MVSKIRIVVDSGVDFPVPSIIKRHRITIVPQTIQFGDERYQEYVEMDTEKFFQRLSHNVPAPRILAPSVEQFHEAFVKLSRSTDQILSLHTSRELSNAFANAKTAADALVGRCAISVVDSKTTSVGLGLLTDAAAALVANTPNIEDVVRLVRGTIDRIYSIFYVDTLDYIQQRGLLGEAQALLGTMLGIKPFLTIEDGHLVTMEKVRTRSQAVDKLVEFVMEFDDLEKLIILQNSPFTTEAVRLLQDRLASEYTRRSFPTIQYGATLASYLGTDATGIVLMERE